MRPALIAFIAVTLLTAFLARPQASSAAEHSLPDSREINESGLLLYRVHPLNDSLIIAGDDVFDSADPSGKPAQLPDNALVLPLRAPGAPQSWLLLEEPPCPLAGHVEDARPARDQNGQAHLEVDLDAQGARLFAALTEANLGRCLAMVLAGQVYSAPVVQEKISGGKFIISGSFSFEEASDLALALRSGRTRQADHITDESSAPSRARE